MTSPGGSPSGWRSGIAESGRGSFRWPWSPASIAWTIISTVERNRFRKKSGLPARLKGAKRVRMKTINQTIHDYWFEPVPAARLGILRILIGGFAVWWLLMEQDIFARIAHTDPSLFAPVGVVFGDPVDPELIPWLLRGTILAGVCFTLGLWHRFTGPIFAGALLWMLCFHCSWSMIYHSMNLLALHVIVLGFTRS